MSYIRALETVILAPAHGTLHSALSGIHESVHGEARLQVLEAAAAEIGGFDYQRYCDDRFGAGFVPVVDAPLWGRRLSEALRRVPVHPSIALSALARTEVSACERRKAGAYYTDFRLAEYLARPLGGLSQQVSHLLDPACGTGILLVASVIALAGDSSSRRTHLVAEGIYGADLSAEALRGTALSLASLTSSNTAIESLSSHLRQADSLLGCTAIWSDVAPNGFDALVGNPPWEKLKLTRHEFLTANGHDRHYGEAYGNELQHSNLSLARQRVADYVRELSEVYGLQGRGDKDLFKLFTELAVKLTRPGGYLMYLVPAGLIRSLGARDLRRYLMDNCAHVDFTLLENRARFFAIDTRFKFLALHARLTNGIVEAPIRLRMASGNETGVVSGRDVHIDRAVLAQVRPDLSIPEVRTENEWRVFCECTRNGLALGNESAPWHPIIMREVDMTLDSRHFLQGPEADAVPVMEGRMVHQYRHAAKRYRSGAGRRADWQAVPWSGKCLIEPQFWFPASELSGLVRERVGVERIGFCDISGQTNERTMLAARVPANVVCGNKVPTILFGGRTNRHLEDCWLAIANSIPFDWLLRRVVTTTVNFFLLRDLPMPRLDRLDAERVAELARLLSSCIHACGDAATSTRHDGWCHAEMRAEIDWRVLHAYGQGLATMKLMLDDFPLLDRSQPPVSGEEESTITKDFLLLRTAEGLGEGSRTEVGLWRGRVEQARQLGAVPYVPSHLPMTGE